MTALDPAEGTRSYHAWQGYTPYNGEEFLFANYLMARHIWGNRLGLEGVDALGAFRPEPFILRNNADVPLRLIR